MRRCRRARDGVGVTAAELVAELDGTLHAAGVELCFAEMKDPVNDKLRRLGLFSRLGAATFFAIIDEAGEGVLVESPHRMGGLGGLLAIVSLTA